MKITLQSYLWPLAVLCLLHGNLQAQSTLALSCSTSVTLYGDTTTNDTSLYNDVFLVGLDLNEFACSLSNTATTNCSLGNQIAIKYRLHLDMDNNGTRETIIDSDSLPPAGTIVLGYANNPMWPGTSILQFDKRPVPSDQLYRFGIELIQAATHTEARVVFRTVAAPNTYMNPELPHGVHEIEWIATDQCGNVKSCKNTFQIKDTKAPTITCLTQLPWFQLSSSTCSVMIYPEEIIDSVSDNISVLLAKAVCENCDSFPSEQVAKITCKLGTNTIKAWVKDAAGNSSFCETEIIIIDNIGSCHCPGNYSAAGTIYTAFTKNSNNKAIGCLADVSVQLNANATPFFPAFSYAQPFNSSTGTYSFINAVPIGATFSIAPIKNTDHTKGVDLLDVLKIQRHILGVEPLSSPYRIVAADVNNSRSITSSDIVELRKLILGFYSELPNMNSYRFITEAHVFTNPNNPFSGNIAESITVTTLSSPPNLNFLGLKVGDVTGNSCDLLTSSDDRTSSILHVEDRQLNQGQTFKVPITTHDALVALQATWQFDGLELLEIIPGSQMSDEDFHVLADGQTCSMAWIGEENKPGFVFRFRANRSGYLSDMLTLTDAVTPTRAYTQDEKPHGVRLRFDASAIANANGDAPILYGNRPNPFGGETEMRFYLPKAQKVKMTVFNALGQEKYTHEAWLEAGMQSITLSALDLGEKGILHCVLNTDAGQQVCKMIAE